MQVMIRIEFKSGVVYILTAEQYRRLTLKEVQQSRVRLVYR